MLFFFFFWCNFPRSSSSEKQMHLCIFLGLHKCRPLEEILWKDHHLPCLISHTHTHTHRCLFGRSFLFIQHRILPGFQMQIALRVDAGDRTGTVCRLRWALQRLGYAGMLMWCGRTCLFCERHFSEAVKVRSPGISQKLHFGWLLVGECVPSGSCPHLQRYSRKPSMCSRDRLCHSSSAVWKLEQMEKKSLQPKEVVIVYKIQACSGSAQMKDELCGKQNQQTA